MKTNPKTVINKEKYTFKRHSSEYVKQFVSEKRALLKILPKIIRIEHFGSTSIKGLGGKGIIDIIIEVPKKDFQRSRKLLEKNGYDYKPHFKKRLFFKKYHNGREVHIHLTYQGTNEIVRAISVRDYLRKHKEEARRYAQLKKKACTYSKGIGQRYRDYKNPYLARLEKKARKEYGGK